MKNGNLEQFLDTGWHMGSELYYHGYVYWSEAAADFDTGNITYKLERWKAECDGKLYYNCYDSLGNLIDYQIVCVIQGIDIDRIKQQFLTSQAFDGKTFWEVENDLIWVDDGCESAPHK